MRAVAVLFLWIGLLMQLPALLAQAPGQPEFGLAAHPARDSIRIPITWTRNEKETATIQVVLMDFEGRNLDRWTKRVRLNPGERSAVVVATPNPKAYGLDSGQSLLGIQGTLGCGCMQAQAMYFFKPVGSLDFPDPEFQSKVLKMKGHWYLQISAKRLARQVTLIPKTQGWLVEENHFDMLPGEDRTVRFFNADKTAKLKVVDVIVQSAYGAVAK